jgi:hypothetical protein
MAYIGAAAFAVMKIHKIINAQNFKARQEFADMTDFAARAGALGFFTKEYIEDIKAELDLKSAIDALIIYGPSGRVVFEKKAGLISYKGDLPDFNGNMRLYHAPQTAPLRTEGGLNVSISALYPLMDFNTLLSILRSSFLAVLIAVTAAFTTLIADVCLVKTIPRFPKDEIPPDGSGREAEPEIVPEAEVVPEAESVPEAEVIPDPEIVPDMESVPEAEIEAESEIRFESENIPELEVAPEAESGIEPEFETVNHTGAETDNAGGGLLAAAMAIYGNDSDGMDEKTEFSAVLQQELVKSEKEGKDIAVLSVETTAFPFESGALIREAAQFFKSGGRFFEKDDRNGIHIIVPDSDLDEILLAAKKFHRHVTSDAESRNGGLFIGISARSSRSVTGVDFMREAENALDKARMDVAMPIVAFKVDPKKYNDFISRQKNV